MRLWRSGSETGGLGVRLWRSGSETVEVWE